MKMTLILIVQVLYLLMGGVETTLCLPSSLLHSHRWVSAEVRGGGGRGVEG